MPAKQTPEFKQAQEDLAKRIRDNRPNITNSSVQTYISLLSNMYYREHSRDEKIDMDFFKNEERIIDLLKDKTPQSRKTVLAAIVVLNGSEHTYELLQKKMKADVADTKNEINEQSKNKKQEDNWASYDSIKDLQQKYEDEAMKLLTSKGKLSEPHLELITRFMMLSISSGKYFPPRRSEMIHIKVKNIDEKNDNYIDLSNNEIVYNQYKTFKKYGQQRVKFPATFKAILKKYLAKMSEQTYLLEKMGKPFLATELSREMYKIFGKKISTSMLRHIFLSSVYKDMPALNEMKVRAEEMAHDFNMALQYVKK
jgi:integrase